MTKKIGVFLLLLALVACADDDKPDAPKDAAPKIAEPKITVENLICPQTAILVKAQEVSDYGGEQPDPAQLVAKARMQKIEGDCAYRADEKADGGAGIDIAFTLHLAAKRGPRLGGYQASFPYFIAVVDPAENILNRQMMTASFSFSAQDQEASLDQPLHVFIPLSKTAMQAGPDYRVLVGFQLPKDIN